VRVQCFQRCFFDANFSGITIDEDDDILLRLALNFQRIEARKFEIRAKVSPSIAIDDVVC